MRIGLVGDTHGYLPALEAALDACKRATCDLIVHCGDFLSTPFTPDPPEETIALLRAEEVRAIIGNGEAYLRDWGTPRYADDLALRRQRADPLSSGFAYVAAGQAELSADDLAWLRDLPDELVLDCARAGDIYVCHGMPGNPFSSIWPAHLTSTFDRHITPGLRDAALSRPGPAEANLILCGHSHTPFIQPTKLPNGRMALAVRGSGINSDRAVWWVGYVLLTHCGRSLPVEYEEWDIMLGTVPFVPRDPAWTEDQAPRRTRKPI